MDLTWEEYLQDHKMEDAVLRNLEIIGEATQSLSEGFRLRHPNVPWRELSGTRDRLIHHYLGVNQEIVWQIKGDLLKLKQQISTIVRETSS